MKLDPYGDSSRCVADAACHEPMPCAGSTAGQLDGPGQERHAGQQHDERKQPEDRPQHQQRCRTVEAGERSDHQKLDKGGDGQHGTAKLPVGHGLPHAVPMLEHMTAMGRLFSNAPIELNQTPAEAGRCPGKTKTAHAALHFMAPRSTYGLTAGVRPSLKPNAHFCHCAALSRVADVTSAARWAIVTATIPRIWSAC